MVVGELGTVRRYSYWSDRRVKSIADDNGIDLSHRWRFGLTTPGLPHFPLPQVMLSEETKTVQRHEVALRVEKAIGQLAVEDFVTSPPAQFVKGFGEVTFAPYERWGHTAGPRKAVIIHTRTKSSDGCRVEVCLFASIDNWAGYLSTSKAEAPVWSSSSTWCIEEFITNEGRVPAPVYDDDESIAVEILRVFNNEGMAGKHAWKHFPSSEWFAEVYHDVELDKSRWNLKPGRDLPEPVDRIVVGAPLWVRSNGGLTIPK